jgi:hypothetical protein
MLTPTPNPTLTPEGGRLEWATWREQTEQTEQTQGQMEADMLQVPTGQVLRQGRGRRRQVRGGVLQQSQNRCC